MNLQLKKFQQKKVILKNVFVEEKNVQAFQNYKFNNIINIKIKFKLRLINLNLNMEEEINKVKKKMIKKSNINWHNKNLELKIYKKKLKKDKNMKNKFLIYYKYIFLI